MFFSSCVFQFLFFHVIVIAYLFCFLFSFVIASYSVLLLFSFCSTSYYSYCSNYCWFRQYILSLDATAYLDAIFPSGNKLL